MFRLLTSDRVSSKPKRIARLHPEIIDVDLEDNKLDLMNGCTSEMLLFVLLFKSMFQCLLVISSDIALFHFTL